MKTRDKEWEERKKRKCQLIVYKNLHYENWQRGQNVWVVNSILITGSLIVTFQSKGDNFLAPLVSLALVVMALIMHITSEHVTSITYKEMEKIGKDLGITEPKEMYDSKIKGKWWYRIRFNQAYFLFTILICIDSFLLLRNGIFPFVVLIVGFLLIFFAEILRYQKRSILESVEERSKRGN